MRLPRTLLAAIIVLASLPAAAREWKEIRIGTEGAYPPFAQLNARKELEGFEIDYVNALCAQMQVKCSWVIQDWDGIIPALLAKKYDVIVAGMSATEERAKKVDFTRAYAQTPNIVIGSKDSKTTDISPAALKNKAIGTQSSTIHANYLEKYFKDATIRLYPTQEEAGLDLANGRLDFVVGDKVVTDEFLTGKGKECCREIGTLPRDEAIHGPGMAMAVRKDDKALLAMLNTAIEESIKNGTYERIAKKYFSYSILP